MPEYTGEEIDGVFDETEAKEEDVIKLIKGIYSLKNSLFLLLIVEFTGVWW